MSRRGVYPKPVYDDPYGGYRENLYDIFTYTNIVSDQFSITMNEGRRRIEGFMLAFTDSNGQPVFLDDVDSMMKVEIVHRGMPVFVSMDNKTYYTRTEQSKNNMHPNAALWTYRYPTNATLCLSFSLKHEYTEAFTLHVNMFYMQNPQPYPALSDVIDNAISNDMENTCNSKNLLAPGYVTWMVRLQYPCSSMSSKCSGNEYPYAY